MTKVVSNEKKSVRNCIINTISIISIIQIIFVFCVTCTVTFSRNNIFTYLPLFLRMHLENIVKKKKDSKLETTGCFKNLNKCIFIKSFYM